MNVNQEKYLIESQQQILNTALNLLAESRANKEFLIMLAKSGAIQFPEGHDAVSYWESLFKPAFEKLSSDSKSAFLKAMQ